MNRPTPPVRAAKWLPVLVMAWTAVGVAGCHTMGYYGQAIRGECEILAHEKSIAKLIVDPQTPVRLKEQLELLERLRAFASTQLNLPVDKLYLKYVDVHRPYVVWNVQAAPRFSLQPKTWWYPLVGRLEYRGYFSEHGARACAARLAAKGYDVYVDGVSAYSTLGWFRDPALNTFIHLPEPELAELLFHELGHQRVFARGDTDFNEAFATTVGQEGARRWLRAEGNTNLYAAYIASLRRNNQFVHLIMNTRTRLEAVYGDTLDKDGKVRAASNPPAPPAELQREKRRIFDDLRRQYSALKAQWHGYSGYDAWFAHELNNAQLNSVANYFQYLPGFEQLLRLNGGNPAEFYRAVEKLSKLPKEDRHQRLRELANDEVELNPSGAQR